MKLFLVLALLSCLCLHARSQQASWDICIDGRKLRSGVDGKKADTLDLSTPKISSRKYLEVTYREPPSNIPWTYVLKISSPAGEPLLEKRFGKEGQPYRLSIHEILNLPGKHTYLLLQLEQNPADPEMNIRSRQVLLAVLHLKPKANVP
jgi:hypothetical protein